MIVPNQIVPVDFLILGAGWTSTFLIPLLKKHSVRFAATSRNGRDGTIPFTYDPTSGDSAPFQRLPAARTVLITFPLKGKGPSKHLVDLYKATHAVVAGTADLPLVEDSRATPSSPPSAIYGPNFIQLGATSIWTGSGWQDETSPYDKANPRAVAEDELMSLAHGCALNLAGLYGGSRIPSNWVDRVIKSKDDLKNKGALHLIHGEDVALAILALHRKFTPGKRWLLTDVYVYDWWDLIENWATKATITAEGNELMVERQMNLLRWVRELMIEEGVRALPRDSDKLGRVLDSRTFWNTMGVWPTQGRAS